MIGDCPARPAPQALPSKSTVVSSHSKASVLKAQSLCGGGSYLLLNGKNDQQMNDYLLWLGGAPVIKALLGRASICTHDHSGSRMKQEMENDKRDRLIN